MKENKRKYKKTKSVGLICKVILLMIVLLIIIMSVIVVVKANKYPNKVPDIFGYKPMIVLSGSMETAIYTGDLVFVKVVDTDTLKTGDIIAFRNEADTVTTHRITEVIDEDGQTYFKTKGDNNNADDENLVSETDVEGVYIFRIPRLGNILLLFKEPQTLIVILLIILVIGLIFLHIADRQEKKALSQEDEQYRKEFEEFKKKQIEKNKK